MSRSCWCAQASHQMSLCVEHMDLLFVVGAMCSPDYCLPSPILLTTSCFSGSTGVSLVTLVCLPILASWCLQSCGDLFFLRVCVMLTTAVLCLPACFPPSGWFLLLFVLFYYQIPIFLHLSPRLISLLMQP